MLANLLPGLRHVRTPLAVGYLYLLAAWLLLGPDRLIPAVDSPGAAGRLAELADLLGRTAALTALSFVAYLAGSIVVIKAWPLGISPTLTYPSPSLLDVQSTEIEDALTRFHEADEEAWIVRPRVWAYGLLGWMSEAASVAGYRVTYRELRNDLDLPRPFVDAVEGMWEATRYQALTRLNASQEFERLGGRKEPGGEDAYATMMERLLEDAIPPDAWRGRSERSVVGDKTSDWWSLEKRLDEAVPAKFLRRALDQQLDEEVAHIMARLRVQSEHVFDDYDRMRSEAELRYSIVPPIVLIVLIGTFTWHWWCIFAIALPAVLLWQAYSTERASIAVVLSAVRYGVVESPTASALRRLSAAPSPWMEGAGHRSSRTQRVTSSLSRALTCRSEHSSLIAWD